MTVVFAVDFIPKNRLFSPMPIRFLTARWSNLALLNYAVPESYFAPYLPPGCVADTSLDGRAYCSLVAFDFLETRVLGIPWPGFRNFPEFNLRLYIRHVPSGDRGVVFVREIIPSRFISAVARWTYNEPYLALPLTSSARLHDARLTIEHRLPHAGRHNRLTLTAAATPQLPHPGAWETFFKEHRWGFNRSASGKLIRYEVVHAPWRCHAVESHYLDWDFESLYGPPWTSLADRPPDSVLLAEGSPVAIHLWKSTKERAKGRGA